MKKIFLNFLLLSFTISLFAQKNTGRVIIPESNLRFKANDDYTEVKITGFKNDNKFMGKILEIPAEIQGVPVTSIGNGAFEYAGYGISGLWIPDCIKKIDEEAFYYSMFSSVRLPNGLETIKPRTFEGCQIKTIELPSSVKKIMAFAFYGSSLESFTIPEGCEIGNPFDKDKGEYLYEKGHVFEKSNLKTLVFPKGRVNLYDEIQYESGFFTNFANCDNLEKIVIPDGAEIFQVFLGSYPDDYFEKEYTLADYIRGEKIEASFALQKQLKAVKVQNILTVENEKSLAEYTKAFDSGDYETALQVAEDFLSNYSKYQSEAWTDRYLLACKEIYSNALDTGDYEKALEIASAVHKQTRYQRNNEWNEWYMTACKEIYNKTLSSGDYETALLIADTAQKEARSYYYGSNDNNEKAWKDRYLTAYEKKSLDDYNKAISSGDYEKAIRIGEDYRRTSLSYNNEKWNSLILQAKYVQAFKNGKLHTNLACNVKGNWSCIINFAEKNGDVIVNGFKAKKSIFEERGLKSKDVIKKIVFSDSSGKESEVSWKDLLTIRAPGTLIFTVERGSGKKAQTLTISASIIWNSDELMYIR